MANLTRNIIGAGSNQERSGFIAGSNQERYDVISGSNQARSGVVAHLWSPDNLPWEDNNLPWQDNESLLDAQGVNKSKNSFAAGTNLTRN